MACSHAEGCPLFPLLNASLRGWRDYYCDSADGWRECARYQMALTGEPVPITLLPNGVTANLISAPATSTWQPRYAPPQQPTRPPQQPTRPPQQPMRPPQQPMRPPQQPTRSYQPSPPPMYPPAQPPRPARRRWWTRLADWISGPA